MIEHRFLGKLVGCLTCSLATGLAAFLQGPFSVDYRTPSFVDVLRDVTGTQHPEVFVKKAEFHDDVFFIMERLATIGDTWDGIEAQCEELTASAALQVNSDETFPGIAACRWLSLRFFSERNSQYALQQKLGSSDRFEANIYVSYAIELPCMDALDAASDLPRLRRWFAAPRIEMAKVIIMKLALAGRFSRDEEHLDWAQARMDMVTQHRRAVNQGEFDEARLAVHFYIESYSGRSRVLPSTTGSGLRNDYRRMSVPLHAFSANVWSSEFPAVTHIWSSPNWKMLWILEKVISATGADANHVLHRDRPSHPDLPRGVGVDRRFAEGWAKGKNIFVRVADLASLWGHPACLPPVITVRV